MWLGMCKKNKVCEERRLMNEIIKETESLKVLAEETNGKKR